MTNINTIISELKSLNSCESGYALLNNSKKPELNEIALALNIHARKNWTANQLKENIIYVTIKVRLNQPTLVKSLVKQADAHTVILENGEEMAVCMLTSKIAPTEIKVGTIVEYKEMHDYFNSFVLVNVYNKIYNN